ncbi:MAG: hydroxyphenylacetyl-CoA thioesterase PaaI [Gammaproteobacteria bacterium]|nr:hydroxyphenylacetyl-CoA thioesterase PaaI [Gammaproteobacteria bacterium]
MPIKKPENTLSALQVADKVGKAMFDADTASRLTLGMQLLSCTPGQARVALKVTSIHLNGHGICHGGFIFTLADTAFALACNSYNKNAVAASCSIEFLRPAQVGDVLTAEALEQAVLGKQGVYDIKVYKQNFELVALFRGKSVYIPGQMVDLETD